MKSYVIIQNENEFAYKTYVLNSFFNVERAAVQSGSFPLKTKLSKIIHNILLTNEQMHCIIKL